jgi:hypothetical protein
VCVCVCVFVLVLSLGGEKREEEERENEGFIASRSLFFFPSHHMYLGRAGEKLLHHQQDLKKIDKIGGKSPLIYCCADCKQEKILLLQTWLLDSETFCSIFICCEISIEWTTEEGDVGLDKKNGGNQNEKAGVKNNNKARKQRRKPPKESTEKPVEASIAKSCFQSSFDWSESGNDFNHASNLVFKTPIIPEPDVSIPFNRLSIALPLPTSRTKPLASTQSKEATGYHLEWIEYKKEKLKDLTHEHTLLAAYLAENPQDASSLSNPIVSLSLPEGEQEEYEVNPEKIFMSYLKLVKANPTALIFWSKEPVWVQPPPSYYHTCQSCQSHSTHLFQLLPYFWILFKEEKVPWTLDWSSIFIFKCNTCRHMYCIVQNE